MPAYSSVPFLRIFPAFCTGVIAWYYYPSFPVTLLLVPVACLVVLLFTVFRRAGNYKSRHRAGILYQLLFFFLGYFLTLAHDDRKNLHHFTASPSAKYYRAYVEGNPVERNGNIRAVTRIFSLHDSGQWQGSSGRCFVYFRNDTGASNLKHGDRILFKANVTPVSPPLNPGQFDFRRYASLKRVYHQCYLKKGDWLLEGRRWNLRAAAHSLRERFLQVYRDAGLGGQEYAVLSALVLGYDEEIDSKTLAAFSSTGTLHILSVSGMHVGIVFSAISALLVFLNKNKLTRILRLILLILSLWSYALLTGLSPSVIRSSMMFSFILAGRGLSRSSNIYNSLALSAFCILLVFDPLMLFEVGLQLSFLAVGGIVYLYPKISRLLTPRYSLLEKAWGLLSVSVAAQAMTFAISLYYFHQFPNYFLLSNLVIIPLSTAGIFSGIGLLLLQPFEAGCRIAGWVVQKLIYALNESAVYLGHLPGAVSSGISIGLAEVVIIQCTLLALTTWLSAKSCRYLLLALVLINVLLASQQITSLQRLSRNQLVVYSGTTKFCSEYVHGNNSCLFFYPADSAKALKASDAAGLVLGISPGKRRIIGLGAGLGNRRRDGVFVGDSDIVIGKFRIRYEGAFNRDRPDNLPVPDLLYLHASPRMSLDSLSPAKRILLNGFTSPAMRTGPGFAGDVPVFDLRSGAGVFDL